jgi:hypothetical protein
MTTKEISRHFDLNQRGVDFLLARVFDKTGVNNRSDLVIWMRDHGLLVDIAADLDLENRLAGGVWGHLVGDAMGVPYEFLPPRPLNEIRWGHEAAYRPQLPGTWSDDARAIVAVARSGPHI